MKKIISLALMLVFVLLALVSCGGDELTPIPEHYPNDVDNKEATEEVDLYIIVGDGTADKALDPIKKYINNKAVSELNVKLNVNYISQTEYQTTVKAAVEDQSIIREYTVDEMQLDGSVVKVTKKAGAVVLVNGFDFIAQLAAIEYNFGVEEATGEEIIKPAIVNIAPYLLEREYSELNITVPSALLAAAKTVDGKLLAFPNARTLGEYTYLVINEEIASKTLKFSPTELSSYKTYEETAALRDAMVANSFDPDDYVMIKKGSYSDKAKLEAEGYICNIVATPSVSASDAYASAYAIVDSGVDVVNDRAMRVINALSKNAEIRNILQYGIEYTNYTVENGTVVRKEGNDSYVMNYMYTGNAFILMYSEEIGWTQEAMQNGINQNKDVVLAQA